MQSLRKNCIALSSFFKDLILLQTVWSRTKFSHSQNEHPQPLGHQSVLSYKIDLLAETRTLISMIFETIRNITFRFNFRPERH